MIGRVVHLRALVRPASVLQQQHQHVRSLSIWNAVQGKMLGKQAEKEEEQFQVELQRLVKLDKYSLRAFKDAVDESEKGSWFSWVNKMPGVKGLPEVQQADKFMKILKAIRDEELEDPSLLKSREKQRIAAESGQTIQEVNQLLKNYENSVALYKWIRRRVKDGKELPKSRADCQVMMMGDPAGISMSAFQPKQRSGRNKGRLPF